jgi:hypothetical protein
MNSPRILQAHCQSRTCPPARQSFVKELAKPPQDKCEAFTNTFENNYKVSKIVFKKFPTIQKNKNATQKPKQTDKKHSDNDS